LLRLLLFAQEFYDLAGIWETPYFGLGEDETSPIFHIENTSAGTNQFGLDTQFFLQFIRQTGGFRFVVSHAAIGDFAEIRHFLSLP
jgi:hypothetical protein